MIEKHHRWNVSFKPPILGFIFSVLLLIAMYRFATHHHLAGSLLHLTILGFAIFQVILQLIFFLHLGMESKPNWNSIAFTFMVLVVIIVIGGSIWIMSNLNYNLMPTMEH